MKRSRRQSMKRSRRQSMKAELKAEMKAELKAEMKAEMKAELKAEMKAELKAEMKMKAELKAEAKLTDSGPNGSSERWKPRSKVSCSRNHPPALTRMEPTALSEFSSRFVKSDTSICCRQRLIMGG